jgi:transglutaminase-like putative cysteine protease
MRWRIRHETVYEYSVPVVLAPHVLRLTPRPDRARVLHRDLEVAPSPLAAEDYTDEFGNRCTRVTFDPRPADLLRVRSELDLVTLDAPPLGELGLPALPWPSPVDDWLAGFRQAVHPGAEVDAFARRMTQEAGAAPLTFLDHLCHTLHTTLDRQLRLDGAAQSPAETLARGQGACRDLAVLFLATCRAVGFAGRFVSGYQGSSETVDGPGHLHAWPEVFLPGADWRGWDPMQGIRAGESHVALCAAPDQAGTMPLEGGYSFSGPTLRSTLRYDIHVQRGD